MSTRTNLTTIAPKVFNFNKLPPELRNQIWSVVLEDALAEDRYIEISGKRATHTPYPLLHGPDRNPLKPIFEGTNLSLLSVNKESRAIAKPHFPMQLSSRRHRKLLYLNPATDKYFIKDSRAVRALMDHTKQIGARSLGRTVELAYLKNNIRELMIGTRGRIWTIEALDFVSDLPSLHTLTVEDTWEEDDDPDRRNRYEFCIQLALAIEWGRKRGHQPVPEVKFAAPAEMENLVRPPPPIFKM